MTCTLVTPWRGRDLPGVDAPARGGVDPTAILDWRHPAFDALPRRTAGEFESALLRAVHRAVGARVAAVYGLDDTQPSSVTLARAAGSCSQRLAVVEACARRAGIATRVEGLVLRGEFWYPRFRHLRPFVPDRVLLAWPSFLVDGEWTDASVVFSDSGCAAPLPFTNSGEETLFDAAARSPISWTATSSPSCLDLSGAVLQSLGTFDSRDELFATYGQTLRPLVLATIDPVFRRRRAR
ncbi:transglutaminase domain-containing protein [Rhodococcus sp. NPDC003348]